MHFENKKKHFHKNLTLQKTNVSTERMNWLAKACLTINLSLELTDSEGRHKFK